MSDYIESYRFTQNWLELNDIAQEISDIENNCGGCDMSQNAGYWIRAE